MRKNLFTLKQRGRITHFVAGNNGTQDGVWNNVYRIKKTLTDKRQIATIQILASDGFLSKDNDKIIVQFSPETAEKKF